LFVHPWAFRARFRRTAFGWKGTKLAIERIHEALAESRAVARHDSASAAEGSVLFLEKLSPALNQIDSSSGARGNATADVACCGIRRSSQYSPAAGASGRAGHRRQSSR
jgi:hypothetical protein